MTLEEHIAEIRAGIKAGRYTNEASVSQGIVLRILQALSWPTYDTQVVSPEFSLEGRRVDFGLCHPPTRPIAFIEVKQIGQSEQAERQLFEYAFHVGIPLAILTDGQQWNFFLPGEQGSYGERRVYKLDLLERDLPECVLRLSRYLSYSNTVSGAAIEAARADYRNVSRERQMRDALPGAWHALIDEEDELLLELVADRVEAMCGYKPDPDTVAQFLHSQRKHSSAVPPGVQPIVESAAKVKSNSRTNVEPRRDGQVGFSIEGMQFTSRNGRDVLVSVFRELSKRDPTFLERFAALPKHGRTRRYLARSPDALYPGRADLARDHSMEVSPGWWLGINLSRATIERIVEMAGNVAGLKFGKDLKVSLGDL